MQILPIEAEKSGLYSPLVLDYLNQSPKLQEFIANWPNSAGYAKQIQSKKSHSVDRERLYTALLDQYEGIDLGITTRKQLESLKDPNTYTITTGQQIHIFLGPMYVYWKIMSAIALSRKLKREFPEQHFVPVFWMATEDHDFAEVNHLEIFNRELVWNADSEFNGPVGHRNTEGLSDLLAELDGLFSRQEEWKEISLAFKEAYRSGNTFAKATRELVHRFFAEEGLIIIDPDHLELKKAFLPQIKQELTKSESYMAVEAVSSLLEKEYNRQLNPREINLFYFDGKSRERIVKEQDSFNTSSGQFLCQSTDLDSFLEHNLERISANVVLRPLYQEVILPNLAYVGGPGEIAYWLQLKGVFDLHEVPYPILENRKSAFVLGQKTAEQLEGIGIGVEDLFLEEKSLEEKVADAAGLTLVDLGPELEKLAELKEVSIGKAAPILPKQAKPMADIFNNAEKIFRKVEKEMVDTQKAGIEKRIEKVLKSRKLLVDKGFTQERNQYIPQYILRLNTQEILEEFELRFNEIGAVCAIIGE